MEGSGAGEAGGQAAGRPGGIAADSAQRVREQAALPLQPDELRARMGRGGAGAVAGVPGRGEGAVEFGGAGRRTWVGDDLVLVRVCDIPRVALKAAESTTSWPGGSSSPWQLFAG
ncbi:hypothetical protein ABZ891_19590 [Streptomyces sp. NPDC047023]|uniref:hypothetical protein n=1 Tax=Streptomyces sp. NPDC047023 TaxID=3155139 RepID=UPI0033E12ECA